MANSNDVIKTLMAMGELYGKSLSEYAARIFLEDLSAYGPDVILAALRECRKSIARFPTVADIVSRADALDGRPGPEEAWAMIPKDEAGSVVWTGEMALAFGAARPLMLEGDLVAARMAFREKYLAEVKRAREARLKPEWIPTFGTDPAGRDAAMRIAVDQKRIALEAARQWLPEIEFKPESKLLAGPESGRQVRALLGQAFRGVPLD